MILIVPVVFQSCDERNAQMTDEDLIRAAEAAARNRMAQDELRRVAEEAARRNEHLKKLEDHQAEYNARMAINNEIERVRAEQERQRRG